MSLDLLDPDGLHAPAGAADLAALEAGAGTLPPDLRAFLLRSDGYEGPVGPDGYAHLWPARAILGALDAFDGARDVPGLLLVGSNAGPTAYGVLRDAAGARWVSVPFAPMRAEELRVLGGGLDAFLRALARGEGW